MAVAPPVAMASVARPRAAQLAQPASAAARQAVPQAGGWCRRGGFFAPGKRGVGAAPGSACFLQGGPGGGAACPADFFWGPASPGPLWAAPPPNGAPPEK